MRLNTLICRKLHNQPYFLRKYYRMPPEIPSFRAQLSNENHFFNLIDETTMRFTSSNFEHSGVHNEMIENENFRLFAYRRTLAALGIAQACLALLSLAQDFHVKIC